jgi:hypothetical protein
VRRGRPPSPDAAKRSPVQHNPSPRGAASPPTDRSRAVRPDAVSLPYLRKGE